MRLIITWNFINIFRKILKELSRLEWIPGYWTEDSGYLQQQQERNKRKGLLTIRREHAFNP